MKKAVFILIISTFIADLSAGPPKVELVKGQNRIAVLIAGEPVTSLIQKIRRLMGDLQ